MPMEVTMLSILDEVKKVLGIDSSYDAFDTDVILHVNAAFAYLTQLGIGDDTGFAITGNSETWEKYSVTNPAQLSLVKQYVYLKVKNVFDPAGTSFVLQSIENQLKELTWRINAVVDK